ncbi:MAG: hypothetical protein R3E31_14950 [Chloroflexota bacterium]
MASISVSGAFFPQAVELLVFCFLLFYGGDDADIVTMQTSQGLPLNIFRASHNQILFGDLP